jgi:hypothetical protein
MFNEGWALSYENQRANMPLLSLTQSIASSEYALTKPYSIDCQQEYWTRTVTGRDALAIAWRARM